MLHSAELTHLLDKFKHIRNIYGQLDQMIARHEKDEENRDYLHILGNLFTTSVDQTTIPAICTAFERQQAELQVIYLRHIHPVVAKYCAHVKMFIHAEVALVLEIKHRHKKAMLNYNIARLEDQEKEQQKGQKPSTARVAEVNALKAKNDEMYGALIASLTKAIAAYDEAQLLHMKELITANAAYLEDAATLMLAQREKVDRLGPPSAVGVADMSRKDLIDSFLIEMRDMDGLEGLLRKSDDDAADAAAADGGENDDQSDKNQRDGNDDDDGVGGAGSSGSKNTSFF